MMLIVDASVAMKWVCEEEGSDRAADRRFYNIVRNTPLLCDAVKLL
jgi:predicted nucleic acid-binding protein